MKNALAIAILLLATTAHAATVVVTITAPTPREADAAAWKLVEINKMRAVNKLPAFANLKAYVEDYLTKEFFPAIVEDFGEATAVEQDIRTLWKGATPAQRAAAVNALKGQ